MFKALMGGGRSSSDARSNSSAKSSSSRRRADSKASSTVSRKSSRGDDRDRGLGDLSAYPSSGSRSKRYASSAAGESVASSYATADPGFPIESDRIVERTPRRPDFDDPDRSDRYRDTADRSGKGSRRRERIRSPSRERERTRPVRDDPSGDADDRDRNSTSSRRERRRTHSGDPYPAMSAPAPGVSFAADVMATPNHQFPGMTTTMPGPETTPTVYDPHVQQQFPGQFPAYVAEPYRPPNPAGEAADYYNDQGQSVAEQPGVRPQPPLVIPNSQAHLMSASPVDNPPPEPSSMGQVGAAAAYYDDEPGAQPPLQPNNPPSTMPPNPAIQTAGLAGPAVGVTAAYQTGNGSPGAEEFGSQHVPVGASPSTYVPAAPPTSQNPPYKPSHSHGTGAAVGAAAAGAAAGYFLGHQHSSSNSDHVSQYTMQNPDDVSLNGIGYPGPTMYPSHSKPPPYAVAGAAAAAGYAAHPSHPHHAAVYHGAALPAGGLAFQQRQRGPLSKFIDFWRDPEGVGMYEDYTESIGVCKYCFEPGTTSRDAPRKHHYRSRRRSSDHYSSGSRVDKLSRYASSEDESRRRRKSRNSWLPGVLTGYAVKSIFNNKDFDDSYSVRTGQVVNSSYDSESVSTRRSRTSRGVYRRSSRSRSRDRKSYHSQPDLQMSKNEEYRTRPRSRSRSSSRSKHTLRDAALGAAIGTAAMSVAKSRDHSRSRSPRKGKSRKSSSSDSSFVDISRPARKSVAGGFGSFFTASSDNRKKRRSKKRRGIFSFNNSSSSSVDNDLAFGTAYAKKPAGKSKKGKKKDRGDVDAALLGLGAAATALAATSHRRGRRRGEILAGKDSRSGPSDYASSATNEEGWEDLDSADQSSSSVSSALAFGESGRFGGDDSSHSSDSSTSLWGWRWGSKKSKKGKKKSQKKDYLPAAAAVGAGALGAAALASARHRDSRTDSRDAGSSSTGSLQQVAPIPTSDPTHFETINVSSLLPEPAFVRPGAIPLQQPQPVTPVSQAMYTSQGESIHAYTAPAGPPLFDNTYGQSGYGPRATDHQWNIASFPEGPSNVSRPHRRSDSSPVPHTEPLAGVTSTSLKRHSTLKEQPSVQFDLTHEQEEKERRAARLERSKRDSERYDGVQLVDRESERRGERESRRYDDREERQRRERDYDDSYDRDRKETDSSSWIGAAAAGTIGAAAAAAVLSRTSNDDSSESSQRRHDERRQKRRAERRRMTDESSVGSFPISDEIEERSYTKRERSPSRRSTYPEPARPKPKYENYAEFFAPEGLRYSPDTYAQREPTSMPTIIEAVPASERSQFITEEPHPDYTNLPWPVPSLKITEPTPPQSLSGSVRDATSPIPSTPEVIPEDKELERETTGSRVSWGKHELHEYEVPSTSSDHDSLDREPISPKDTSPVEEIPRSTESSRSNSAGKSFGADIEFAATVAAATAAAGFDPSIITEDPVYHTRSSPPGSEKIDSWTEIVPHRDGPRGFVEGEVDTPQEKFIESEPLYSEPVVMSRWDNEHESQQRPSIAQEVIAQLNQKREPEAGEPSLPESSPEQDYSMPGGFGPDTSRERVKDDSRSVVSAPMPGDFEDDSRRAHDFEMMDNASTPASEEGTAEGKKKRRKRRSKRDSGDFMDDSASVTSSPVRIGEVDDKGKRGEEKEKKSGGFLSNLFGSRVSEPVESKKSSSDDGRVTREVQSEIGPRTSEESRRRRKERSSSRRSSGHGDRLDDAFSPEDNLAADKENINVESYKSSRQRREERRRQRHEGILDSDKGAEAEKDREISQDHDEQPFSDETRELPMTVDDGDQWKFQAPSLGQEEERQIPVSGEVIEPSSRVASSEPGQEQDGDEDAGQRSRRSSILRSTESPTAVPLHFRRPPTSPGTPSATSPVSPSTGSPTQTRHRRPNSTEFRHSREIRPLWLVERHGVTKMEPQEDEPLPSLPSSKTSSANASVEDLTALPDEKSWEQVDLSHYVHGTRDLDLSSPRGHDSQYDILDSQQGTPTAALFAHHHPPSRKDQLKYEFHSPSELLQDPSTYAELPPSPTLGALPSAEGSAVGIRDDLDLQDLPPLPSSRPSTPEGKMITMDDVDDTTPTQAKITPTINRSASPKERDLADVAVAAAAGAGLASLIGAEVAKQDVRQVEMTPEPLDKTISDAPTSEFVPGDREVPESPASAVFVDAPSAAVPDSGDESSFQTPVDAPLASPEDFKPIGEVHDEEAIQEASRATQAHLDVDAAADEPKPVESTNDTAAQPEEPAETSTSSKKKKKKKDKKKKNKAAETATQDVAPEEASVEPAPIPSEEAPNTEAGPAAEEEPAAGDQPSELLPAPEPTTEVEEQQPTEPVIPEELTKALDSSNLTEMDQPVPEPEAADAPTDTTVSSKKAKRDKKKKKKSQAAAADEPAEPAPAEAGDTALETSFEEALDNTEEQRAEDTPKSMDEFLTPTEERSKSPELEGQSREDVPSAKEAVEQPETEPTTREFPAADDGLQASTEPATTQETQETVAVPVESGDIEPTVAEEGTEQTPTVPAEQQLTAETEVTSTEPKNEEIPPNEQSPSVTVQEPQVEAVQDVEASAKSLEAETDEGATSTEVPDTADQPEPSPDSAAETHDADTPSPEVETSLSRKSSKKKKKNKKKAAAEVAESETTEASPSVASGEATPTAEAEPTPTGEVDLGMKPEEPSGNKDESTGPPQSSEEPEVVPEAPAESIAQEPVKEVTPDEPVEEPPMKKKKKKKNRKSAAALTEPEDEPTSDLQPEHQPESQPEAGPAEDATATPPHEETSGELPQPAADIDAQALPEPATNETQQEPAAAEHVDTIPAITDEEPTQQPVESSEANDGTTHVPEETVAHEAGEVALTGKKSKKKKKKGSVSFPVDESMASTESRSLDAVAEPANVEPESQAQTGPEPEPEPSAIDQQPEAEQVQEEEKPAEGEAPSEPAANAEEPVEPVEPAVPMTAAQKKKAKKEKKKKRQSALLEETTTEQAAEAAPAESDDAPVEPETSDSAPTEEATGVAEPAPEEPKDAAVTEAEPIEQETTVAPTQETEQRVSKDVAEEPVTEEPVVVDAEAEKEQDETPIVNAETESKQEPEPVPVSPEDESQHPTMKPTVSGEPTTMRPEAQPEVLNQQDPETVQHDAQESTAPDDAPEQPVEESPKAEAEEVPVEDEAQPAPSAKSKKDKKKKKKRQSLALEEEQPVQETTEAQPSETPVNPVEVGESKEEVADAESADKSEEPTPEDIAKDSPQEPEPQVEEPAPEATSQDAPVPVEAEQQQQQAEAAEEPQPVLSKKQAKKEKKKKRKSVSFATEEPESQALESTEPAAEPSASLQENGEEKPDDHPVEKHPDDSATSSVENSESIEPTPAEGTGVSSDVPQEQEEPKTSAVDESAAEPAQDAVTEEQAVTTEDLAEQPTQAEADLSGETQHVEAVEQNAEESSKADAQVETETVQKATMETPPEAGDKAEFEPISEQPATELETPIDTEPEATTPKSKKDKKKKKKKKQKALELSEDVSPTPESQDETPQPVGQSEKQVETPATELNDAEGTTDSGKREETSQLAEEPRPEMTEEEPKEPETVHESLQQTETQENSTAVSEAEPSATPEEPQPSVPEEETQNETAKDDAMATLSAKERRKAKKKEKKRHSKNLDVDTTEAAAPTPADDKPQDETPAADDTTRDTPVEEAKPADKQSSLETAIAPAEDHGKDNQSHGTDMHADTDKDMIWTDEMVSSQVEQQQHQSLPQATSSESPLPPVRDFEGGAATPGEEIKAVDKDVDESGVAGEVAGRDLSAGAEESNHDEARAMMEGGEEVVMRECQGGDAPLEQTDEHVARKEETEDLPTGGDLTEPAADAPLVTEEAVPQDETVENQTEKEEVVGSEATMSELVTSSKKKSKKEKKKQRQAQKALASAEELSGELAREISEPEHTADVEASEPVHDQLEAPEEKVYEPEETEPPASGETPGAIVEGSEKEAESTVPVDEVKMEEAAPVLEDETRAEEPKETVEGEEPAKEIEATGVEAEPVKLPEQDVEAEQMNEVELMGESGDVERELAPVPESVSEPLAEERTSAKENLDATTAEPTENKPEEMPEEVEGPTLSRKESKKKKKKAKKQAKEQELSEPVPVNHTQDEVPADTESTQLKDSADVPEVPREVVEEEPTGASEQPVEEKEPTVSLDPFEASPEEDKNRSVTTELAEQTVQDYGQEKLQQEEPTTEETEARLRAQVLEKGDDLEMAEDLLEGSSTQPEAEVTVTRKLSKKEKRKAKQQAKLEAFEPVQEPTQEPEPETKTELVEEQQPQEPEALPAEESPAEGPLLSRKLSKKEKKKAKQQAKLEAVEPDQQPAQEPEPEARTELVERQQPQEPEALSAEESLAKDPLLSRNLSKKEKKKKQKGKSTDESQTIESPAEPTTHDDDAWPTIDWEKGQVDSVEKTPQASPEVHHVTPFEPAITEFDESAIPEGVSRQVDEPTVDESKGGDVVQEENQQALQTSVPDMTKEAHVEAKEIPETTEEPVTEYVTEQFLHDVMASVPEKRRMDQADVLPHKQSKVASIFPHLERGLFKRPTSTESLRQGKDGAEDETVEHEAKRDSAIPVSEAPISIPPDNNDSGYVPGQSPEQVFSVAREPTPQQLEESATPGSLQASRSIDVETPSVTPLYAPTPIHEQTSTLISSAPVQEARQASPDSCELRRSPSIHGRHNHPPRSWSLEEETSIPLAKTPPPPSLGPSAMEASPPRTPLHTIAEDEADGRVEKTSGSRTMGEAHGTPRLEMKPEHVLPRPQTPVRKFTDNALDRQRWPTPDPADDGSGELEVRKRGLQRGLFGSAEVLKTPDQGMPILRPSSVGSVASSGGGARSLRRTNRSTSGDLRAAATLAAGGSPQPPASPPQPTDLSVEHLPSSSSYDPLTDKGKRPLRSMTDVYEGWGETPSSPRSPSRPPSIRHRRSMQHLQELESRLDQLISENRLLIAARDAAEDKLRSASVARRKSDHALNTRDADLRDREAELEQLKNSVDWLQKEVSRLTEENAGLSTTNSDLTAAHVAELQSLRESSSRELEVLRYENQQLSTDLHEKIRQQIDAALTQKNAELRRLREELEGARDKVKELQQQIAASMHDNVIVFRDEDYFDAACQKLCGHVQQWVLRFSKHSDHHRCRKLIDLQDEKIADRFDNAILDGSDADIYLADRVRRRDVFMSVVMTMVWEFIFTRYLFGMDREQRQKLKSLEKQLTEVGPRAAIHRWRATTLTLLAKRPAFARQRESDTEAVALEIFDTLSRILPPPSHVEAQLLDSLRKVLRVAVNLSIEMRTQLAEYIMLPPLQPEYDINGDLSRQVYFNASLMNERSGETTSNEELESQQAVVRVVLFPLVVKKGNDSGEGDDEVVVCPAQVLIARPGKDKKMSRIFSNDRMSLDATKSVHSIAPSSTMDMSNVI